MFGKCTTASIRLASLAVLVSLTVPAEAKHSKQQSLTNIFTPPADLIAAPTFITNKNKTASLPKSLLDGNEEPRWDIIKTLPDMSSDQTKSLNKLQQETQKTLSGMRTQMNEAQQELNELKAHKTPTPRPDSNPAVALLNPDGKPYMGPLLGTEEMGMNPAEESMEDVQAQIDGLKEKIKEVNLKAASQAKTILSQDQKNELDMMQRGQLVVHAPTSILVDSPAEPSLVKAKSRRELASSNPAGLRVLRSILTSATRSTLIRPIQI